MTLSPHPTQSPALLRPSERLSGFARGLAAKQAGRRQALPLFSIAEVKAGPKASGQQRLPSRGRQPIGSQVMSFRGKALLRSPGTDQDANSSHQCVFLSLVHAL